MPVHEGPGLVITYANGEGSSRRSGHVLIKYRYTQKQLSDKKHPISHNGQLAASRCTCETFGRSSVAYIQESYCWHAALV